MALGRVDTDRGFWVKGGLPLTPRKASYAPPPRDFGCRLGPHRRPPPGQPGWIGGDNRLFVDAVLWIARTGAPWRDLLERFGKFNSIWRRFDRWARTGFGRKSSRRCETPIWNGGSSTPR